MSLPSRVIKKDGHTVRFDREKLVRSIEKAARHARFDDAVMVGKATADALRGIETLSVDPIPVHRIRAAILRALREEGMGSLADAYDLAYLHLGSLRIQKVEKRSGRYDDFRPYNIFKSLLKPLREVGEDNPQLAVDLTREVVERIEADFARRETPTTAAIKRAVEEALARRNLRRARDAYQLHRYR